MKGRDAGEKKHVESPEHNLSLSANERDQAIAQLLRRLAPGCENLAGEMRRWMREYLVSAHEIVYEYKDAVVISYSPSKHGYEGVFAARADSKGLKLYFNFGKDLKDPSGLLHGKGKQVRWLDVDGVEKLGSPEVKKILSQAREAAPVKFPENGEWVVAVRFTSAAKRRESTSK